MARISEDARNCSVFLGWDASSADNPAALDPEGTGFLIYSGEGGASGVYLVTAAHIARKLRDAPFVVRMNDEQGRARLDHIDHAYWYFHPKDSMVDIALMRYEPPHWTSSPALPTYEFLDPIRAREWDVGPGDAVYVVGLFYLHAGKNRNLAVVYSGNIALMPSDDRIPVGTEDGGSELVEAYLVEAQGVQGVSGSQVVIRPTVRHIVKENKDNGESIAISEGRDYLLGVWIAAWPGKPDLVLGAARGIPPSTMVPVGMGLVVKCDRIVDILSRSDLIKERREAMKKSGPPPAVPSGLAKSAPSTTADNPSHKEAFSSLVDAAAKKRPQDGQT